MNNNERLNLFKVEQLYRTIRTGLKCITTAVVAYFVWNALKDLSGHDTNLAVKLLANVDVSIVFSWLATASTSVWAVKERRLRVRKVEQMQARIRQLEEHIDPNRTSSGLTVQGGTNEDDKDE